VKFLSKAEIYKASGIPANDVEDLDAIAVKWGYAIFLSLETNVDINTTDNGMLMGVPEGSILAIPFYDQMGNPVITWAFSSYDGACRVAVVTAGSGVVWAWEGPVDAWIGDSGIRDKNGNLVFTSGDLDGLELDPDSNQPFFNQGLAEHPGPQNGLNGPNLIFAALNLTGSGIVSIANNGSIALINGVPMDGADGGIHVGLVTACGSGSLNGLALSLSSLRSRLSAGSRRCWAAPISTSKSRRSFSAVSCSDSRIRRSWAEPGSWTHPLRSRIRRFPTST
jgi:hypothetical protein